MVNVDGRHATWLVHSSPAGGTRFRISQAVSHWTRMMTDAHNSGRTAPRRFPDGRRRRPDRNPCPAANTVGGGPGGRRKRPRRRPRRRPAPADMRRGGILRRRRHAGGWVGSSSWIGRRSGGADRQQPGCELDGPPYFRCRAASRAGSVPMAGMVYPVEPRRRSWRTGRPDRSCAGPGPPAFLRLSPEAEPADGAGQPSHPAVRPEWPRPGPWAPLRRSRCRDPPARPSRAHCGPGRPGAPEKVGAALFRVLPEEAIVVAERHRLAVLWARDPRPPARTTGVVDWASAIGTACRWRPAPPLRAPTEGRRPDGRVCSAMYTLQSLLGRWRASGWTSAFVVFAKPKLPASFMKSCERRSSQAETQCGPGLRHRRSAAGLGRPGEGPWRRGVYARGSPKALVAALRRGLGEPGPFLIEVPC